MTEFVTDVFRQRVYLPLKHVIRKLYYQPAVRSIFFFPERLLRTAVGARDPMIPPKSKIFIGPGDFTAIGLEFLRHFIGIGGLEPNERVLDVGCGIGRMAIPLTRYLGAEGSYEGFDIVDEGIEWCQTQITPRFPRFRFTVADVYNGLYRPDGRFQARDYVFPYPAESFDFVFLTSVFTHMLPADIANYVRQIARVLRPGGRCLMTCFLLNDEVRQLVARGKSSLPMREQKEGYSTIDRGTPEYDIAFPQPYVASLLESAGLIVAPPIHYGKWCGRAAGLTYQDVILVRKGA